MPKGPRINPEVEALIASVYRKHPDWKAPRIRAEVEHILFKSKKGFPRDWPGLSAVQKVLAVARRPQPPPEEWSLASLDRYPIPLEALPAVVRLEDHRSENSRPFYMRDAKWAARLSPIIEDMEVLGHSRDGKWATRLSVREGIEVLDHWVDRYSYIEALFESIGRPLNSRWLDLQLMGWQVDIKGSDIDQALQKYMKTVDHDEALLAEVIVHDEFD